MLTVSNATVKTGVWINHDYNRIHGTTLTISIRNAAYLVAFLALYVSITGNQLWAILRYILHQTRAQTQPRTGLKAQQQIILRNVTSSFEAAFQITQLMWAWRRSGSHALRRSIYLVTCALTAFLGFTVAVIFSSRVTKAAGSNVLVTSTNCGYWTFEDPQNTTDTYGADLKLSRDAAAATNYARSCYGAAANGQQCTRYVKQYIQWDANPNASCPFIDNICILNGTKSFQMDTGYINSHTDLGINAVTENRILYRRVFTCAPIKTATFMKLSNTSIVDPQYGGNITELVADYYMGPFPGISNFTYRYNVHAHLDNIGYTLYAIGANAGDPTNIWIPVPQLNRTDADVSLFFLAPNSIQFTTPVDDPWFSAHRATNRTLISPPLNETVNRTWFYADSLVNVLGCADQYQYCNPNTGNCTPLSGWTPTDNAQQGLGFNDYQTHIYNLIANAAYFYQPYVSVEAQSVSALIASETVSHTTTQVSLPNNQWTIEVSSWFATTLASLQRYPVDYASGPSDIDTAAGGEILMDQSAIDESLCNNQKVHTNGEYQNFSVLGLCIIIVIGSIIIILSFAIERVTGFIQRRLRRGNEKRVQWIMDSNLQLQRMLYESAGYERWEGPLDLVPTLAGEELPVPTDMEQGRPGILPNTSLVGKAHPSMSLQHGVKNN